MSKDNDFGYTYDVFTEMTNSSVPVLSYGNNYVLFSPARAINKSAMQMAVCMCEVGYMFIGKIVSRFKAEDITKVIADIPESIYTIALNNLLDIGAIVEDEAGQYKVNSHFAEE